MNYKNLIIILLLAVASALCSAFISQALAFVLFSVTCVFCFARHGFFVLAPAAAAATLSYILGGINAASCIVLAIPASFILGFCFFKSLSFSTTLSLSALTQTLILFLGINYASKKSSASAVNLIFGNPEQMLEVFSAAGQDTEMISQMLDYMYSVYDVLLPFILIMSSAILVYCIFGISRFFIEKSGKTYDMPYFSELCLPRSMMTVFLILAVISLIGGIYSPILLNVLFIIASIIIVCGLSLVSFYFKRLNVSKPLRILIYIIGILFLSPIAELTLLFLGIRDSYRNFRALKE